MNGTPGTNTNGFHIAQWGNGTDPGSGYHGLIDEVRLSDVALDPTQLGFSGSLANASSTVSLNGKLTTVWGKIKQE